MMSAKPLYAFDLDAIVKVISTYHVLQVMGIMKEKRLGDIIQTT
jgi:hypothetical protein